MKDSYEMIEISNGQIAVMQEVQDQIKVLKVAEKQLKSIEARLKAEMYKAMREYNVKQFESDTLRITRIDPSTRKQVDVQKLKDDGLYEEYSYVGETNGYAKIEVK